MRRWRWIVGRSWSVGAALTVLAGCSELDVLQATFQDELVEAQARGVQLKVVSGTDCPTLLTVEHTDIETVASVLAVRRAGYPINPDSGILNDLPRNRPLLFDLAVFDQEGRQVARACEGVTLPGDATEIVIEVDALPDCGDVMPRGLDIAVVFDVSRAMLVANAALGSELQTAVSPLFEGGISPGGDRWTLVTHGPSDEPEVAVPFTDDAAAIEAGIDSALTNLVGPSRLYDATRLGTIVLRSRAVCGRRSALVIVAAGRDEGPRGGRDLAISGLAGTRQDPNDDLFGIGIGLSREGRDALELILIEDLGRSRAALTASSLANEIRLTRERLQALIGL